jgi:hypothetical protein
MVRWLALIFLFLAAPAQAATGADTGKPDLVLTGQVLGAEHQTYKPVTFDVPDGVTRLTVEVDYARDQKTVVDLGLLDPVRFRGWSGGNKKRFTLSAEDATPSYLPGPLPAGRWTLLLGVPNARPGSSAAYEARITFERGPVTTSFAPAPLKAAPGWYRGDLHMHTAHSDGSCLAQSGVRAPCPVYRTVEAAKARGLDFIAITDHNTTSHYEAMAELQPAFDQLLLIPGREVTTFQGHANVFGPTAFIDFRLGDPSVPDIKSLQGAVAAVGGVFSINHPSSPSGEQCMGCGWTVPNTDYDQVQSIEVANGGSQRAQGGGAEGPLFGVPFWEAQLNTGHRITAVGGSDNHDAGLPPETPGAVGRPTTVVHAEELSTAGILAGVRAGRVFIDLDGTKDRMLDLSARAKSGQAVMGGVLTAKPGEAVTFTASLTGGDLSGLEVIRDGAKLAVTMGPSGAFTVKMGDKATWVRLNFRDAQGRLLLIGNPIYLRPGR